MGYLIEPPFRKITVNADLSRQKTAYKYRLSFDECIINATSNIEFT
jgi:hypothetical protein